MKLLPLFYLFSLPAQASLLPELEFRTGSLAGWDGTGFAVVKVEGPRFFLSSEDSGARGKKGLIHRAFVVPPGARAIRFQASAVYGKDLPPSADLDIVLLAAGKRTIPKLVHSDAGWRLTDRVLPTGPRRMYDYVWRVGNLQGQTLRVALVDEDDRPGCYLRSTGFRVETEDPDDVEFTQDMLGLAEKHRLGRFIRYETRHFVALGNADAAFCEGRLRDCEVMYALFGDHFRTKGFTVNEPDAKLTVALFDTQAGFEAFLGRKMPPYITGIYHTASNRFVMYDFAHNPFYVSRKQQAERQLWQIAGAADRQRYLGAVERQSQAIRGDTNVGTIMHEVTHQLSYNCGLLNRYGDVPAWLAEGLACYCEPTADGSWKGLGAPNPERLDRLARTLGAGEPLLPLRALLAGDNWVREQRGSEAVLLGYAQAWALFRMLMEEQPQALRKYLALIAERRTPDHRLTDFQACFGAVLEKFEAHYAAYVQHLTRQHKSARK